MCMCMGPVGQIVLLLPTSLKTTCTASLCDIDFIGALKSLKAVLYGETKSAKIKDEMSN